MRLHCKNVILANMFVTRFADNGYIVSDSWYCSTLTCACPYYELNPCYQLFPVKAVHYIGYICVVESHAFN